MRMTFKKLSLIAVLLLLMQIMLPPGTPSISREAFAASELHLIDLSRWGIHNDGTHPVATTKGINEALQWANENKVTAVTLPSGTYLIDKDSRINMVSNMRFELPDDAVLQKEANDKENYTVLYLGNGIHDVTLKGGMYRGDRETHDYSKKDHKYSAGTHEAGHGILAEGASNIRIEGVTATHFTGDGLVIGGYGKMITDIYENWFVSGSVDSSGQMVKDNLKIRTKNALKFDHTIFKTENSFELSNFIGLSTRFEVYFYTANGKFITKTTAKARDEIHIPEQADRFYLVLDKPKSMKGIYLEYWKRVVSSNVVVTDSEFAFNRRQGITVGGANQVNITRNSIHDMKGTAPQSGIDVEGGFGLNGFLNSHISITKNELFNNAAYDIVLYDGHDAIIEDNHLASKGAIGLAVSNPFTGAKIINNHFDGSRIHVEHDAEVIGNKMNDSYTYFQGPNIKIDGMQLTDSTFSVSAKVRFGVSVSNVTINNSGKSDSGLSIWGEPIRLKNVTVIGAPTLRSVTGGGAGGSVFDHLRVIGYNSTYGLSLPPGTYNDCEFEGAEGGKFGAISANIEGKYVFNRCKFKSSLTSATLLYGDHPKLNLQIMNSTFEVLGNAQAINVQAASNLLIETNTIKAMALTSTSTELIKLNDYWKRNERFNILKAVIRNNTIRTNLKAVGISTAYAGIKAPPYTIEKNTLYNATLALKSNDIASGNILK